MGQNGTTTGEVPVAPAPAENSRRRQKILAIGLGVLLLAIPMVGLVYGSLAQHNATRTEYQDSWAQYSQMSAELAETMAGAQELLGTECAVNTLNPELCNHGREILAEAADLPQLTAVDITELSREEVSAETAKLDASYREAYRINNDLSTATTDLKAALETAISAWWEKSGKAFLAAGESAIADADAALSANRNKFGAAQLAANLAQARNTMQEKLTALQSAYAAGMTITQGKALTEEINQAGINLRAATAALQRANSAGSSGSGNSSPPPANGDGGGSGDGTGQVDPQPIIPDPDPETP